MVIELVRSFSDCIDMNALHVKMLGNGVVFPKFTLGGLLVSYSVYANKCMTVRVWRQRTCHNPFGRDRAITKRGFREASIGKIAACQCARRKAPLSWPSNEANYPAAQAKQGSGLSAMLRSNRQKDWPDVEDAGGCETPNLPIGQWMIHGGATFSNSKKASDDWFEKS